MLPPEFDVALSRPVCEINAVDVIHRLSNLFTQLFHENRYLPNRKENEVLL